MEGLRPAALFFLSTFGFYCALAQSSPSPVTLGTVPPSTSPYYGGHYNGPYASASASSNGNQPSGSLSLNNAASNSWDPSTFSFTSSSNTNNAASGGAGTLNSNTNAYALVPVSSAALQYALPTEYAQATGNAFANGQALTGNLNNLDLINSLGQAGGPLSVQSSSIVNGTGTGVTLSSFADVTGNAYVSPSPTPYVTVTPCMTCSTLPIPTAAPLPRKSVQQEKFQGGAPVRSRSLRKKLIQAVAPVAQKKVLHPVSLYHRPS